MLSRQELYPRVTLKPPHFVEQGPLYSAIPWLGALVGLEHLLVPSARNPVPSDAAPQFPSWRSGAWSQGGVGLPSSLPLHPLGYAVGSLPGALPSRCCGGWKKRSLAIVKGQRRRLLDAGSEVEFCFFAY